MTPTKEQNKALVTDLKEMEIYKVPDKKFKIITLKKLTELQENTEWQFNGIRKTLHEQNEKFNKEIETTKKNKTEVLELNITMTEMKNSLESYKTRLDQAEESVNSKTGHFIIYRKKNKKNKE